jgi:hypothetical protein
MSCNGPLTMLREYMRKTRRKKSHTRTGEEETETEDDCDDKQREEMLDEDEITAAENAFMQGREMKPGKRKRPPIKTLFQLNSLETNIKKTNQVR